MEDGGAYAFGLLAGFAVLVIALALTRPLTGQMHGALQASGMEGVYAAFLAGLCGLLLLVLAMLVAGRLYRRAIGR